MRKLWILLVGMVLAAPARAVSTSHWVQANGSDFRAGTTHDVVVTNLGDVKLSRAVTTIQEQDPHVTTVNALVEGPGGVIYAGTGPKGLLLAVKDGKVSTVATIANAVNILALAVDDTGGILLGTGGDKGRVLRIAKPGEKPKEIFSADGVQYIWALACSADGHIYAATGPAGQVFDIKPDGSHAELYKSSDDNITSMISDGKDLLYLGTDPNGLVVRLNRQTGDSFIMYNAGETEITALALDESGDLFAATGEAGERQPPPAEQPEKKSGRPEQPGGAAPIPSNPPPAPPKPPPPPNPNPGQPKPIPQKQTRMDGAWQYFRGDISRCAATSFPLPWYSGGGLGWGAIAVWRSLRFEQPSFIGKTPTSILPLSTRGGGKKGSPEVLPRPINDAAAAMLMDMLPGQADVPGDGGGGDQPNPDQPGNDQQGAADANAPDHGNSALAPPTPVTQPPQPQGNAIYRIDQDGFVTEIFRQDVVIYAMIRQGNVLLVGTGGEGNIYQVDPAAEETEVLAKVDAKEVMCLLPAKDGRIFMGLANTGGISALGAGYASEGTYISPVLDATQVSRFGKIQLHGQLPDGTGLLVATRSGNVKDADVAGWSPWSADVAAVQYSPIAAAPARFLQYRLTFKTSQPGHTPLVNHVDVTYQIPNLAPVIKSIKIGSGDNAAEGNATDTTDTGGGGGAAAPAAAHADSGAKATGGTGVQTISWDASDTDNDPLTYTLYYRLELSGPWVLLKDKLKDTTCQWDTRTVADGNYQVRVVASNALANPPGQDKTATRISDYFVVDNTPPMLGDLTWKAAGNNVKINLRVQDRISIIANVEYTLDSSQDWQAVLPTDNIFDSPDEKVSFTIKGLTPGPHQVAIRATDAHGNQTVQAIVVTTVAATTAPDAPGH